MNSQLMTTGQRFSLAPQTITEAMHLAKLLAESTMVPKDYQNRPGNVLVAMQWGMELGLGPMQSLQNISVINGRPSVWGDTMLGLVWGSGLLEAIDEQQTDEGATCTIQRKGQEPAVRTFTVTDAKKANLWGKAGPWTQYPKRMMQMRARAFALRDVFPDVLRGIHIAEEAQDIPVQGVATTVYEAKHEPKALPPASSVQNQEASFQRPDQDTLNEIGRVAKLINLTGADFATWLRDTHGTKYTHMTADVARQVLIDLNSLAVSDADQDAVDAFNAEGLEYEALV